MIATIFKLHLNIVNTYFFLVTKPDKFRMKGPLLFYCFKIVFPLPMISLLICLYLKYTTFQVVVGRKKKKKYFLKSKFIDKFSI